LIYYVSISKKEVTKELVRGIINLVKDFSRWDCSPLSVNLCERQNRVTIYNTWSKKEKEIDEGSNLHSLR
jgi:hypothetical protein